MIEPQHAVALVLGTLVLSELIRATTQYFFKKLTKDDYVTKTDCEKCASRGSTPEIERLETKFDDRMSEMRGILLVVALKAGVPPEELKHLTS